MGIMALDKAAHICCRFIFLSILKCILHWNLYWIKCSVLENVQGVFYDSFMNYKLQNYIIWKEKWAIIGNSRA